MSFWFLIIIQVEVNQNFSFKLNAGKASVECKDADEHGSKDRRMKNSSFRWLMFCETVIQDMAFVLNFFTLLAELF